jgi:CxxC motif-containing protein (DUF1111 family)
MRSNSWSTCSALTSIVLLWLAACEPPRNAVTNPAAPDTGVTGRVEAVAASVLGDALPGLTAEELALFEAGKEEFEEVETIEEGLGPVFNEAACSTCHTNPLGGTTGRLETRFGRLSPGGEFDPMTSVGGSLIQDHGIGPVDADPAHVYIAEVIPADATITAGRITTPLFGLGLVDAVPDQYFLDLARLQAATSARTAGTPNMVFEISSGRMRVGRFGWKAQVPTLFQFSGDAYLNEMGITNPEFPSENCPQGDCATLAYNPAPDLNDAGEDVAAFHDFMRLLAPPARGPISLRVITGGALFVRVGCASCHTPSLATGPSPVAAMSRKVFRPFSDFLLHDMGSLGDGVAQGAATGRQMRTAPLWGVRTRTALLHDGRATTIRAAIAAHDGQGRFARERFLRLSFRDRAALLAFLNSL